MADRTIKGISIEIGADTAKFNQGIKDVNRELSGLAKETQTLNAKIKLDPDNVELYAQKVKVLTDREETLKQKLEALQAEQKELGATEVGSREWNKLEDQIRRTETSLMGVQSQVKATSDKLNAIKPDSVQSLEKNFKSTADQLRLVDQRLKLDPHNTELVAKKAELLAKAEKEAGQWTDKLSSELKRVKLEGAPEKDVQKLETELEKAKLNAEKLQSEMKQVDSSSQNAGKSGGDGIGMMSLKMSGIINVAQQVINALTQIGQVAYEAWKEADEGLDNYILATGDAIGANVDMSKAMQILLGSTNSSMAEIGKAVGDVNTMFGTTGDDLIKLTQDFIRFGEVSGAEVSPTIQGMNKALQAFGYDADRIPSILDQIAKTAQESGASAESLVSGIEKGATQFQEMGLSAEQAIKTMGAFNKAGIDVESGLGVLQKAQVKFANNGKDMNAGLQELSDILKSDASQLEKTSAVSDLVGKRFAGNTKQTERLVDAFKTLGSAGEESADTVNKTWEATANDLPDKIGRAMEQAKFSLGDQVGEMMKTLSENINMDGISEIFSGIGEVGKTFLEPVIGGIGDAFSKIMEPINSVIDTVKDQLLPLFESPQFKQFAEVVGGLIGNAFSLVGNIISLFISRFAMLFDWFARFANFVIPVFLPILSAIAGGFNGIVDAINWVVDRMKDFMNLIHDVVNGIGGFIAGLFGGGENKAPSPQSMQMTNAVQGVRLASAGVSLASAVQSGSVLNSSTINGGNTAININLTGSGVGRSDIRLLSREVEKAISKGRVR